MLIREVWLRQVKLCLRHSEVLRLCRNVKLSAPQHLRSKLHCAATSRCEASLQAPRGALRSKKTTFVYQTNVVFFVVPLTGLEPVRSCPQRILSPRCLPFHHNGVYCDILAQFFRVVKIKPPRGILSLGGNINRSVGIHPDAAHVSVPPRWEGR